MLLSEYLKLVTPSTEVILFDISIEDGKPISKVINWGADQKLFSNAGSLCEFQCHRERFGEVNSDNIDLFDQLAGKSVIATTTDFCEDVVSGKGPIILKVYITDEYFAKLLSVFVEEQFGTTPHRIVRNAKD